MRALEYVYVVGNGHAVKIGKSTTPEARIASLHTASSSTLVTHYVGATNGEGGAIEREAHSLLRPFRLNSEWFSSTPEAAMEPCRKPRAASAWRSYAAMPFELKRPPRRSMLILAS